MSEGGPDLHERLVTLWCVLGLLLGLALSATVLASSGHNLDDELTSGQVVLVVVTMFGPIPLFGALGSQLSKEVIRGKTSWATYWSSLFGIVATALAIIGVAGFGDLVAMMSSG